MARLTRGARVSGRGGFTTVAASLSLVFLVGCAGTTVSTGALQEQGRLEGVSYVDFDIQLQSNPKSCGAAVVASGLSYWGIRSSEADVLSKYPPVSDEGYSFGQLKVAMEMEGLRAFAIKGNEDVLYKEISNGRPVIIPIRASADARSPIGGFAPFLLRMVVGLVSPQSNHFVVVVGFSKEAILLADPTSGIRMVDKHALIERWSGDKLMLVFGRVQQSFRILDKNGSLRG